MFDGDIQSVSDNMNSVSRKPALITAIGMPSFCEKRRSQAENTDPYSRKICPDKQEKLMRKAESQDGKKQSPMEIRALAAGGRQELSIQKDGMSRRLTLPEGFEPIEEHAIPGCLYAEFKAENSAQTRLAYWNRGYGGRKLSPETSLKFKEILAREPHVLSAAEMNDMSAVLANGVMKNEGMFQIKEGGLRTENLADGSTVLVMDAEWPDGGLQSHGIFADFDGTGNYVEQVYLIAARSEFQKQYESAREAMRSLRWSKPQ